MEFTQDKNISRNILKFIKKSRLHSNLKLKLQEDPFKVYKT